MKIAIVGAGAMGSLFGARLAESGCDVTLIDINAAHVDAINRDGLAFRDGDDNRTVLIEASRSPQTVGAVDLIVLFCKYLDTRAAMASAVPMLTPETYAWTLQNGIGNVEIIKEFVPESRIVKGLTSVTAIIEHPGAVATYFRGESETFAWPVDGASHPVLQQVTALFTRAGLPSYVSADIDYRIWRKLAVNCSLTVLSAAANIGIGPVGEFEPGRRLLRAIIAEVVAVAQASGVSLDLEDGLAYVEELRAKAASHIGSTTVDLQGGRATEIDVMNGAVVRLGKRLGVPTPANATLADFIRLIEATRPVRLPVPI
jgi:2-dehydropantoate 2-reductase